MTNKFNNLVIEGSSALRWYNLKAKKSPGILELYLFVFDEDSGREITWLSWRHRFQNFFRPQENTNPAFSNSSGLKSIFENVSLREGLPGMVDVTVEIKLRLQNPPVLWRRDLKFHCGITQTEHHAEYVYYGLVIIFELVSCFDSYQRATSIRHMAYNWNIQTNIWLKRWASFSPFWVNNIRKSRRNWTGKMFITSFKFQVYQENWRNTEYDVPLLAVSFSYSRRAVPCEQSVLRSSKEDRRRLCSQGRRAVAWRIKALANEGTLLRTLCCWHKCFPVCLRAQHLLRTQILCPGHKKGFWFRSETFCVRNKCFPLCAAQETSWATICPQQCVLVYQGLNWRKEPEGGGPDKSSGRGGSLERTRIASWEE